MKRITVQLSERSYDIAIILTEAAGLGPFLRERVHGPLALVRYWSSQRSSPVEVSLQVNKTRPAETDALKSCGARSLRSGGG